MNEFKVACGVNANANANANSVIQVTSGPPGTQDRAAPQETWASWEHTAPQGPLAGPSPVSHCLYMFHGHVSGI